MNVRCTSFVWARICGLIKIHDKKFVEVFSGITEVGREIYFVFIIYRMPLFNVPSKQEFEQSKVLNMLKLNRQIWIWLEQQSRLINNCLSGFGRKLMQMNSIAGTGYQLPTISTQNHVQRTMDPVIPSAKRKLNIIIIHLKSHKIMKMSPWLPFNENSLCVSFFRWIYFMKLKQSTHKIPFKFIQITVT